MGSFSRCRTQRCVTRPQDCRRGMTTSQGRALSATPSLQAAGCARLSAGPKRRGVLGSGRSGAASTSRQRGHGQHPFGGRQRGHGALQRQEQGVAALQLLCRVGQRTAVRRRLALHRALAGTHRHPGQGVHGRMQPRQSGCQRQQPQAQQRQPGATSHRGPQSPHLGSPSPVGRCGRQQRRHVVGHLTGVQFRAKRQAQVARRVVDISDGRMLQQ
jgi:hypothetical protein